jgi:AcrR family transcriptional regulator
VAQIAALRSTRARTRGTPPTPVGPEGPVGLRELNSYRRRRSFLIRARHLFRRKGFEATTMTEIARAARAAPRTLYNFFPAKIDLLAEIMREDLEQRMMSALAAEGRLPPAPYDGVLRLIEMQARVLDAWPRRFLKLVSSQFVATGLDTIAGRMHASAGELFATQLEQRLRAYQARGRLAADTDIAALARAVFACLRGAYFGWLCGNSEEIATLVGAIREHLRFLLPPG